MRVCHLLSGTCCRYQHVNYVCTNEEAGWQLCAERNCDVGKIEHCTGFYGFGVLAKCQRFLYEWLKKRHQELVAVLKFIEAFDLYNNNTCFI